MSKKRTLDAFFGAVPKKARTDEVGDTKRDEMVRAALYHGVLMFSNPKNRLKCLNIRHIPLPFRTYPYY